MPVIMKEPDVEQGLDQAGKAVSETYFHYRLFGWIFRSDRALPLLVPAAPAEPDVDIRFRPVVPPSEPCIFQARGISLYPCMTGILNHKDRIRIRITAGRTLDVEIADDVGDAELSTVLFGPALGVLCHQRGCPPLHASGVQIGTQVVAIAGDSGVGKSTTARALIQRGHRLLTDDQLIVSPDRPLVHPSFPSMKLWIRSVDALGDIIQLEQPVMPWLDKYHVPSKDIFQAHAGQLGLILILSADPTLHQPIAEHLSATKAAATLSRYVYRPGIGAALGRMAEILRWAALLAARIPVYHLRRPDNLAGLDDLARLIEDLAGRHVGSGQ